MPSVRVGVLGPATLEVDGAGVPLPPTTIKLLVRLVAAAGEAVSIGTLRREVWGIAGDPPQLERRGRTEVQKRVLALRRVLDPAQSGEGARLLRTERLLGGRRPESAYRLVLEPGQLDSAQFARLVNHALLAPPASAVDMLTRALDLWRGPPLREAGGARYAEAMTRRLNDLHQLACAELVRLHTDLGRPDLALPLAERAAAQRPDEPEAARTLAAVRGRLRERHGGEILRREFAGLRTAVVVVRGDLFEQRDANLVVGFTDTFDVATGRDVLISRESVQGQLLDRLFGGRVEALDQELRRGLRPFKPMSRESRQDKPQGKRIRYPIGTAVPLALDGRRVFATAYSRLGNDLVARSSPRDLRLSLEQLWVSVARHGMFKTVAMPLVGSGLARIRELGREELMVMIIDSFLRGCRENPPVAPELRIVLRPEDLEKTHVSEIAGFVESLDENGIRTGASAT